MTRPAIRRLPLSVLPSGMAFWAYHSAGGLITPYSPLPLLALISLLGADLPS